MKRRPDRLYKTKKRLNKYNIKYEVFEACDGKKKYIETYYNNIIKKKPTHLKNTGELGCILSHLRLIQIAKKNNYKNILILEDDILLHKFFDRLLFKIEKVPDNYDILYLGCSHNTKIDYIDTPFYYKIRNHTFGTFAYAISNNVYDLAIYYLSQFELASDNALNNIIYRGNSYAIYEYLIIADITDSDIRHKRNQNEIEQWNIKNYEK